MAAAKFLQGRVALVTGATSRLGQSFARALAGAGASVFLVARREEKLRKTVGEITAAGGEASYHVTDLRTVPALYDLVDVVLARYKKLHILVNNAGSGWRAPLEELKRSEIAEMLDTGLAAPIYLTQAALPALKRNAPSDVVNVSSPAGLKGFARDTGRCAARHGLVGFSRALAEELEPDNVRVTTLCAGPVESEIVDGSRPEEPGPRSLPVDDVARALLGILASPPGVLYGEIVLRPRAEKV